MGTSNARRLRKNRTDAERALWARLRRKQLDGLRFRQQVPLGPYIVDFLCPGQMLVVEVDGGQHVDDGAERTAWLEARGFRVLRFWNNDVLQNPDGVIETILLALRSKASPPPHPAPIEGAGEVK